MLINQHFLIFLTSWISTYFIDDFTLRIGSLSIDYWLSESQHIYILNSGHWSWGAPNKGFVDKVAFENARATLFWSEWDGHRFLLGPNFFPLGRPRVAVHILDPYPFKKLAPKELVGVGSVSPFIWDSKNKECMV